MHPQQDPTQIICDEINAIEKNSGVLLIPAFSLERTQEIIHRIYHLKKEKLLRYPTAELSKTTADSVCMRTQFPAPSLPQCGTPKQLTNTQQAICTWYCNAPHSGSFNLFHRGQHDAHLAKYLNPLTKQKTMILNKIKR